MAQHFGGYALLMSLCILHTMATAAEVVGSVHLASRKALSTAKPPVVTSSDSAAADICASLVVVHGYKCEDHEVITDDGFILGLQRIPEGKSSVGGTRPPVVLQHGVIADGATWLLTPPEQNLPLILAENGFDVWISNFRGTPASRRHVTLDPKSREFWNWSWDELMAHDIPSVFDLVFSHTGQKIHYVGHSLGTLVALVGLSEGKLVDRLRSAALLSPIAYLSHMKTTLGVVAAKSLLPEIITALGIAEFDLKQKELSDLLYSKCQEKGIECSNLLTVLSGENCCLNLTAVDLFFKYEPSSTSVKTLFHLSQIVRDHTIAKFNYGKALNFFKYGTLTPPKYNLSNIPPDFPLFMSYGGHDSLSDTADVTELLGELKPHDGDNKLTVQFVPDYAHVDFIMGYTAKDVVYENVVAFFNGH